VISLARVSYIAICEIRICADNATPRSQTIDLVDKAPR
jgi:hypothetical protein